MQKQKYRDAITLGMIQRAIERDAEKHGLPLWKVHVRVFDDASGYIVRDGTRRHPPGDNLTEWLAETLPGEVPEVPTSDTEDPEASEEWPLERVRNALSEVGALSNILGRVLTIEKTGNVRVGEWGAGLFSPPEAIYEKIQKKLHAEREERTARDARYQQYLELHKEFGGLEDA